MRTVDPLPFVPVTWTTGTSAWGSPSAPTSARMRSSDSPSTRPAVASRFV